MEDIIKIFRNALVELVIQNSYYETESIVTGAITSVVYIGKNLFKLICQGREKYLNKGVYIEFFIQLPYVYEEYMTLTGFTKDKQIEIILKNDRTKMLLAKAINNIN